MPHRVARSPTMIVSWSWRPTQFNGTEDLLRHLFELSQATANDYKKFEKFEKFDCSPEAPKVRQPIARVELSKGRKKDSLGSGETRVLYQWNVR